MIKFLKWLWSQIFGGPEATFISSPLEAKGWGLVNEWATCPEEIIDALADNGCNCTHIELLMWGSLYIYDESNTDRRQWVFNSFGKLLKQAKKRGIFVCINFCNANVGNMKYPENGKTPLSSFDDAWFIRLFEHTVEKIKRAEMENHVALQAVSEWDDKQAERWCKILADRWPGHKLWNRSSRPESAPVGHIPEYHPLRTNAYGPHGSYVLTDTGSILNEFGGVRGHVSNHDKLRDYVQTVRAKGNGFCFYCFNSDSKGVDYEAIKTIGRA